MALTEPGSTVAPVPSWGPAFNATPKASPDPRGTGDSPGHSPPPPHKLSPHGAWMPKPFPSLACVGHQRRPLRVVQSRGAGPESGPLARWVTLDKCPHLPEPAACSAKRVSTVPARRPALRVTGSAWEEEPGERTAPFLRLQPRSRGRARGAGQGSSRHGHTRRADALQPGHEPAGGCVPHD